MISVSRALEMAAERGPRYCVTATIRPNEHSVTYTNDAEDAERARERYESSGHYMVRVYPPQGSVDLAKLGRERADARRVADEKTTILRAAVLRALEEGRAEAEIARTAGIDRMTVRKWAGKE